MKMDPDSVTEVEIVVNDEDSAGATAVPQKPQLVMASKNRNCRTLVRTEHLAILVSSYHKHYSAYCRGRKNVLQRVPRKVWNSVYEDFTSSMKESCVVANISFEKSDLPAERTLQDALRSSLDQDTGVSDAKGAKTCSPQDEDMLVMLKRSDGHARRNMLQFRDDIVYGKAQELVESGVSSSARGRGAAVSEETEQEKEDPAKIRGAGSLRKRGIDAIEKIAFSLESSTDETVLAMKRHTELFASNNSRQEEMHASLLRFHEAKMRRSELDEEFHAIRKRKAELDHLISLRDIGVLSETEFIERAKLLS
jgi:hypothetical protein